MLRRAALHGTALAVGSVVIDAAGAAAPARHVVAMEYRAIDGAVLAGQIADVAKRCWIGRDPAFAGLRFDRVEQGQEATTYRVIFAEQNKPRNVSARTLRVLVGRSGSAVMVLTEQQGIDVRATVGRDATSLIKGRPVGC